MKISSIVLIVVLSSIAVFGAFSLAAHYHHGAPCFAVALDSTCPQSPLQLLIMHFNALKVFSLGIIQIMVLLMAALFISFTVPTLNFQPTAQKFKYRSESEFIPLERFQSWLSLLEKRDPAAYN